MKEVKYATAFKDLSNEAIDNLKYACEEYNDFDGQAMIILDSMSWDIETVVGQVESCNLANLVIISKNLKESKELYVTPEEIQLLLEQKLEELN